MKCDDLIKVTLVLITLFSGIIALESCSASRVSSTSYKYDYLHIEADTAMHKGKEGVGVIDMRNGNTWFVPDDDSEPVFLTTYRFDAIGKQAESR